MLDNQTLECLKHHYFSRIKGIESVNEINKTLLGFLEQQQIFDFLNALTKRDEIFQKLVVDNQAIEAILEGFSSEEQQITNSYLSATLDFTRTALQEAIKMDEQIVLLMTKYQSETGNELGAIVNKKRFTQSFITGKEPQYFNVKG